MNATPKGKRIRRGQRQRFRYRQLFIASTLIAGATVSGLLLYFQLAQSQQAKAAFNGDYRTVSSGSWQTPRIWETFNGTDWVSAGNSPDPSSNTIEICEGHTVMVSTKIQADQLLIDKGGKIEITGGTLTVQNGPGIDMEINGSADINGKLAIVQDATAKVNTVCNVTAKGEIKLDGKITVDGRFVNEGGKIPVEAGLITITKTGVYEHAFDGGSLPIATWEDHSTCEITGVTNLLPDNISQPFSNLKWNCLSQVAPVDLQGIACGIKNDFTVMTTGSEKLFLDRSGNNKEIEIKGNLNIKGGTVCLNATGSTTLNIRGSLLMNAGQLKFNVNGSTGNSKINIQREMNINGGLVSLNESKLSTDKGIVNLSGNLSVSGTGIITENSNYSGGEINFTGRNDIQFVVVNNNIRNNINYNVKDGATVRMDNYALTGDGDFSLNSGGAIMIGSPQGISQNTMTGNICVSGKRYYDKAADYIYNCATDQVTGDGLPSQVHAFTLSTEKSCRLNSSLVVNGQLTLVSGNLITGKEAVTLGSDVNHTGRIEKKDGWIAGNFSRWISAEMQGEISFPVGTKNYPNEAKINFTKAPTKGGEISCAFETGNMNKLGLPLTDEKEVCQNAGYGYWNFTTTDGFDGGIFDITVNSKGFPGVLDYSKLHLFTRKSLYTPWTVTGKHSDATGSNSEASVTRKDVDSFGIFGITSDASNTLPAELIFFQAAVKNKQVDLKWSMATEVNNDFFNIERSDNGVEYKTIATIKGAGTTSDEQEYSYRDFQPLPGTSYYRLRQTTFSGKSVVSTGERVNIRNSDGLNSSVNIQRVGPNPFNSLFTTEYYSEGNGDVAVELYDATGKSMFKTYQYALHGTNTFTFDKGSSLPAGEYMVRVSNSNGVSKEMVYKK